MSSAYKDAALTFLHSPQSSEYLCQPEKSRRFFYDNAIMAALIESARTVGLENLSAPVRLLLS